MIAPNNEVKGPNLKDILRDKVSILENEKVAEKQKIDDVLREKRKEGLLMKEAGRVDEFVQLNGESVVLQTQLNLSNEGKKEVRDGYQKLGESLGEYKGAKESTTKLFDEATQNSGEVLESMGIKNKKGFLNEFSNTAEISEATKIKNEGREKARESIKKIREVKKKIGSDVIIESEVFKKINEIEEKKVGLVLEQIDSWAETDESIRPEINILRIDSQELIKNMSACFPEAVIGSLKGLRFEEISKKIKETFGEEIVKKTLSEFISREAEKGVKEREKAVSRISEEIGKLGGDKMGKKWIRFDRSSNYELQVKVNNDILDINYNERELFNDLYESKERDSSYEIDITPGFSIFGSFETKLNQRKDVLLKLIEITVQSKQLEEQSRDLSVDYSAAVVKKEEMKKKESDWVSNVLNKSENTYDHFNVKLNENGILSFNWVKTDISYSDTSSKNYLDKSLTDLTGYIETNRTTLQEESTALEKLNETKSTGLFVKKYIVDGQLLTMDQMEEKKSKLATVIESRKNDIERYEKNSLEMKQKLEEKVKYSEAVLEKLEEIYEEFPDILTANNKIGENREKILYNYQIEQLIYDYVRIKTKSEAAVVEKHDELERKKKKLEEDMMKLIRK